jgi:hypothetical protein
VFDDLAQEAITTCRRNLSAAADLLSAKKDRAVDSKLFLVRHLLILKEMTAGLELGRKDRQRDWHGITGKLLADTPGRAHSRFPAGPAGQCQLYVGLWARLDDAIIRICARCEDGESSRPECGAWLTGRMSTANSSEHVRSS